MDESVRDKATAYRTAITQEFCDDLAFASSLASRVYSGSFLMGGVPQRMVEFTRRSAKFRVLMQDLFAGTQSYLTLRDRLFHGLGSTLRQIVMNSQVAG